MNACVDDLQDSFLKIMEIRSRHIIEALNDQTKTDDQKIQRIKGRLNYDTGHLINLKKDIMRLREQGITSEEEQQLENLLYRIDENAYFDEWKKQIKS